uniref:Uncharacterized protein n=1 Tax=Neolamprologus brichardi TaxID=32507 RepID=A0A3Q4HMH6_NEOBR
MVTWTGLLFVLCGALTSALCCDWLTRYKLTSLSLQVESKLVFIRDSLQLIFCLYRHDNLSAAPWGADKTEGFLTVIHRQITELSACVSGHAHFTAFSLLTGANMHPHPLSFTSSQSLLFISAGASCRSRSQCACWRNRKTSLPLHTCNTPEQPAHTCTVTLRDHPSVANLTLSGLRRGGSLSELS